MQEHLITLLIKVGVAASIASFGVRSSTVRMMLLREDRTLPQRASLALWFAAVFTPGVLIRVVTGGDYAALDLGLEGALLAGIVGGYMCGWITGMIVSIPAMWHPGHGELLSLPFYAAVGFGGGLLRDSAFDKEEIWRFSPFPDVNLWRVFQHGRELRSALFHLYFSFGVVAAELLRQLLKTAFPERLFSIASWNDSWVLKCSLFATTYFCITLPLKVWNSTRNEEMLEDKERLLMQARLETLSSQINPHFLFNTLNSVTSLIRINPEQARTMILRLSRIMRGRLRNHDDFAPLREELEFIEDYLSIELVRFGDKLRVVKEIGTETTDVLIPSMLLQPLVENCIKHGISSKIDGGTITLRTRHSGGRLIIEVQDDGVGIPEPELTSVLDKGIGVKNVNERLKVLYGSDYRMWIDSQPGKGTRIEIEVPVMQARLAAVS